jgi:hypothetical protein
MGAVLEQREEDKGIVDTAVPKRVTSSGIWGMSKACSTIASKVLYPFSWPKGISTKEQLKGLKSAPKPMKSEPIELILMGIV